MGANRFAETRMPPVYRWAVGIGDETVASIVHRSAIAIGTKACTSPAWRQCSTKSFAVGCLRVSKSSMDGRRIVRLLCAMAIACLVAIVPGIANAASFAQCPPSAFIAPDGDLRVELGRRWIAFAGTVASIDAATLRRELAEVRRERNTQGQPGMPPVAGGESQGELRDGVDP